MLWSFLSLARNQHPLLLKSSEKGKSNTASKCTGRPQNQCRDHHQVERRCNNGSIQTTASLLWLHLLERSTSYGEILFNSFISSLSSLSLSLALSRPHTLHMSLSTLKAWCDGRKWLEVRKIHLLPANFGPDSVITLDALGNCVVDQVFQVFIVHTQRRDD
jgi:hypothetical protein